MKILRLFKNKIKLLSVTVIFVLLICAGYSILSFEQTDLQSILKKESSKRELFIDHNESRVCSIQYEAKDSRTEKIYFEFADKYVFDMESKFSLYYDSNYLMIDSFEYEVLKNNLIHTKRIEKGNAPASSHHEVISWYNKFNVAGCNVTKVTIGFKVINQEIDLSNITEMIFLYEE